MTTKPAHDDLFATAHSSISDFVFDEKVALVFADMIKRSVPGYSTLLTGIASIAHQYAQANTNCYDLGCSTGASTLAVSSAIPDTGCKMIAVDNSSAMIQRCHEYLNQAKLELSPDIICADVRDIKIENASVVVMNLTLQFVPIADRQDCIDAIYNGLLPGGILILSEKINFTEARENQWQQTVHHTFKQLHGYSDLEISQKRTALEKVLIPETLKTHQQRLAKTGFKFVTTWFQCFNFISMIAIK
ncbi:MAG: carboxy-S-adenosyl-L-methionine synthase CmoA [Gammaproteobacteria bacterium]|nr:carboxy-S-adenosyl-L-methionine synthase CmoA [Gammaproteobacteria bacterium]